MKQMLITLLSTLFLLPFSAEAADPGTEIGSAVILMYHRFGESRHPSTNITVEQFEQQLRYISENNFRVLPLDAIVRALSSGGSLPERTIAITIDDAYRSVYDIAYPRLKALGFPFTVFISTGGVDNNVPAFMNWDQVKEMHNDGVLFANHTVGHEYLVRRKKNESAAEWKQRIHQTIADAQQRLVDILGSAPNLFAYPYGEYTNEVQAIVNSLGMTAFGQHSGAAGPLSDRLALPRFPMAEQFAGMDSFQVKVNSLPLPVLEATPSDPLVRKNPPSLTITLTPGPYRLDQISCYYNDRKLEITPLDQPHTFRVSGAPPLPAGRSRYNCTAPAENTNRYYWFSQPWIVPPPQ